MDLDEILEIFVTNIEHDGSYIPVSAIKAKIPEAKAQIVKATDVSAEGKDYEVNVNSNRAEVFRQGYQQAVRDIKRNLGVE